MSIASALTTYLNTVSDLTDLVSARIYSNHLPETPTYPAIVHTLISGSHLHDLDGASGIVRYRVQFDVWGRSFSDVVNVSEELRLALQGKRGATGGEQIVSCTLQSEIDLPEETVAGSGDWLYRRTLDFNIGLRESKPSF